MKRNFLISSFVVLVVILTLVTIFAKDYIEMKKVSGNGFANPRQLGEYLLYKNRENKFIYYEPVENIEDNSKIVENLFKKVNFNPIKEENDLNYSYKEIFLVENEVEEKNKRYQHVQVQYHSDGGRFLIFSAYEVEDFADDFQVLKEQYKREREDLFGNEVEIFQLTDEVSCIYFKNTSQLSLNYMYYDYNREEETITLVNSAGNEILAYKDGILYDIAFNIELDYETITDLLNDFIKE